MYFYWFIIMIFTLFQASAWVNMPSLPRMEDASLATTVREDLPDIQKRDTLRVITQHSASSYFLFRGDERGLEYELARQFADMLDVHLQMVIPPTPEDMIPWLMEGKGDIIAPGLLTAVPNHPVALRCLPYDSSYFVVVTRGSAAVASLDELAGRTVHAIPSGPGYYALIDLNTQLGGAVTIAPAPSGWDY
ncbi:MAG TPA: transporter substrate-binding domain-containing protein, partial [Candidatus Latescibacteria bacterium]|nr:transporter substrate-binding domain-containing protein [Candidatus Latescibacterota bacterium]